MIGPTLIETQENIPHVPLIEEMRLFYSQPIDFYTPKEERDVSSSRSFANLIMHSALAFI